MSCLRLSGPVFQKSSVQPLFVSLICVTEPPTESQAMRSDAAQEVESILDNPNEMADMYLGSKEAALEAEAEQVSLSCPNGPPQRKGHKRCRNACIVDVNPAERGSQGTASSQALVLMNSVLSQIASAMSRPEEAPTQVLGTTASEAHAEAACVWTPDEALHSIHEEPDEGAAASGGEALRSASRRPSATSPDDLQRGSSRGPSFTQPAVGIERQSAQPSG